MASLYTKADNDELIARIKKLTPSSQAQWGKMDVAQMMAHCSVLYQMSYGELPTSRSFIGFIFGKIGKKQMLSAEPLKKNLPTIPQSKIADRKDFEKEHGLLINYVARMAAAGPGSMSKNPHPFFGVLNTGEWDKLHYKHMNHHLQQFGV